jgi:Trypsin-co-occurring domain 1
MEGAPVSAEVVRYQVDDHTVALFEIEPVPGFRPASTGAVAGTVEAATQDSVAAARVLLDRVKEIAPGEVQLKFGIKVTGTANWLIAKAATEANFEVTLIWSRDPTP